MLEVEAPYRLRKIDEAIRLNEIAEEKERASDAAFRTYFVPTDEEYAARNLRSRAASARNRDRAFEEAAGDADRAWYSVGDFEESIYDIGSVTTFAQRLNKLRELRAGVTA